MSQRWAPGSPAIEVDAFAALVAGERFLVIHFWAEWDGYDLKLDAALKPVRSEFEDRVAFRSLDIDRPDSASICRQCNVVNVPSLACFVDGRLRWTVVGVRSTDQLRRLLGDLDAGSSDA